jgi:hypothetical protein
MTASLTMVNWLAVVVAAMATFFLGALWYTAIFGGAWARLNGYTELKLAEIRKDKPPALFFTAMIVAYLLIASVVAMIARAAGVASAVDGALLGLLLWIGLALGIGITAYVASDKPVGVYAIDLSYQLIFLVMIGAIVGAWA